MIFGNEYEMPNVSVLVLVRVHLIPRTCSSSVRSASLRYVVF